MNLRERRKRLEITQEELANIVGVSHRTIQRHEKGMSQSPAVKKLLERELSRMEKRLPSLN